MNDINKEVIKRLIDLRKGKHLTQAQVAQKTGLSRRYINKLENGHINKLRLMTVLNYLDACEINFANFFNELEKFITKKQYDQIVSAIDFPKNYKLRKKVDRDIAFYHTKIQGKKGKAKPLSFQAQHKAVVKFGIYRSKIDLIESIAYKIIADSVPNTILNPFYRAFVREIYKQLKKNYSDGSHPPVAGVPYIQEIIKRWVKQGLKEEILEIVKEVVISHFKPIKPKQTT